MSPLDELKGVVSPAILSRARMVSSLLTDLGVPHVLVGGLAVGVHGYPRATKDVDFMVGAEAFERTEPFLVYRDELAQIARVGETDIMSVPRDVPALAAELRLDDGVPVVSLRGLVVMKLLAFSARDRDDIRVLVGSDAGRVREVADHVRSVAPGLLTRLGEALAGL